MPAIVSFAAFWPYYLGEHAHPWCRRLHFIGTTLALGALLTALGSGRLGLLVAVPLLGYGFAWVAHFLVEKNRPATFTYPLWSLRGDAILWWKMLTLRLDPELERLGITWPPARRSSLT